MKGTNTEVYAINKDEMVEKLVSDLKTQHRQYKQYQIWGEMINGGLYNRGTRNFSVLKNLWYRASDKKEV